jgi:hypothetical protein
METALERKRKRNREYMRIWTANNRAEANRRSKEQYKAIKADPIRWARRKATAILYRLKNKEREMKHHREYMVQQRKNSIQARLSHNFRTRLWGALYRKKTKKICQTEILLGCSIPELKIYIEKQFTQGMNWQNYGRKGWHIDHKIPLDQFDLTDLEQQKKAFHYTNLQPLWAIDNLIKGNGRRNYKIYRVEPLFTEAT